MVTRKEQMHEALGNVLKVVSESIKRDLNQGKNIALCLSAYNEWQEDECDGQNYIFNLDNADDLKFLVANDMMTASDISWVMGHKNHCFNFDNGIKMLPLDDLIKRLIRNAEVYMAYAIMYVGRAGVDSSYANIYEEYVTNMIEGYFG